MGLMIQMREKMKLLCVEFFSPPPFYIEIRED